MCLGPALGGSGGTEGLQEHAHLEEVRGLLLRGFRDAGAGCAGWVTTNPSDSRVRSASRTGTRETPYRRASTSSVRRPPRSKTPETMSSRIAVHTECAGMRMSEPPP